MRLERIYSSNVAIWSEVTDCCYPFDKSWHSPRPSLASCVCLATHAHVWFSVTHVYHPLQAWNALAWGTLATACPEEYDNGHAWLGSIQGVCSLT